MHRSYLPVDSYIVAFLLLLEVTAASDSTSSNFHRSLNDHGNGSHNDDAYEGEEPDHLDHIGVVSLLALCLIMLTVLFEFLQHNVRHWLPEGLFLVLDKFYGELTVLGFLGMITFCVSSTAAFGNLSERLLGSEHDLLHHLEYVHYALFFVMVFFVLQVAVLMLSAASMEKKWRKLEESERAYERLLNQEEYSQGSVSPKKKKRLKFRLPKGVCITTNRLLGRPSAYEEQAIFAGLRQEFLLERSRIPPFSPSPDQLEADFWFSRYLSLSQTSILQKLVQVEVSTWLCIAASVIIFYAVAFVTDGNMQILAYIWMIFGWASWFFNIYLEQHLYSVRKTFVPKSILAAQESDVIGDDSSAPYYEFGADDSLPGWADVDLDSYMINGRNFLERFFVKEKPSRSQAAFFMDAHGPHYYILVLQISLIYTGLYAGLLLLSFVPAIVENQSATAGVMFVILSCIPLTGMSFVKHRIVTLLAQVCSLGSFRKPQLVGKVLQEAQSSRMVRTFLVLCQMRRGSLTGDLKTAPKNHSFTLLEQQEIDKTFNAIDKDSSGSISRAEVQDLLGRLGAPSSEGDLDQFFATIDANGDNEIQRSEFLLWYKMHFSSADLDYEEYARDVFDVLASTKSDGALLNTKDAITSYELKTSIDALDMGFSAADVGAIIHELDHDGDGTITVDEFVCLLRKHYPRELHEDEATCHGQAGCMT